MLSKNEMYISNNGRLSAFSCDFYHSKPGQWSFLSHDYYHLKTKSQKVNDLSIWYSGVRCSDFYCTSKQTDKPLTCKLSSPVSELINPFLVLGTEFLLLQEIDWTHLHSGSGVKIWKVLEFKFWSKKFRNSCCVFQPAFGCARRNIFFSCFSTFIVYFKAFSVISLLKSTKKHLKMNKKTWYCLLLKAGRLPEGVPWNCLFSVDYVGNMLKIHIPLSLPLSFSHR